MRWRPFTWLLLSVFCFVAAVYFWRLGDQWAARKGPTPPPTNQLKPKVPSPQPQSHSQAASMVLLSQGTLNALPAGHQSQTTNHQSLQYRLSNTTRTIGQLARNDRAILLENALLDTEHTATTSIPAHLRAQGEPGAYIVQSRAPLDGTFRALLQTVGAGIVSYIPNNAYLVRASAAAAQQLVANPQTQTVIPYEPYYKLKSSLLKLAVEQGALPDGTVLNVLLFADARDATIGELQKLGSTILGEERSPFGPVLKVQPPADSLPALARLPGVQLIESSQPRALANDLSRTVVGVSSDTITTTNYLGLSGANILIAVNDSGVDATHPDLVPRVLGDSPLSLIDSNGHGTHVAGIIAGTGLQSSTLTNVSGSIMPGTNSQFRGMAPSARLFSLPAESTFGALVSDTYLQEAAARTNAFISNNSWNYSGADAQTYDLAAASYDAAVRDALPRLPGSQPVLFVFSAGNNGGGDDNGTVGNPDSIQSPATAKNVITGGAIEQPRQITNAVDFPPCTMTNINGTNFTICQTNTPWFEMTDSDDQVAGFSSRGNVGIGIEGDFGRFKPDVVAPGTFVVSTRSKTWDEMSYYTSNRTQVALNLTLDTNALFSNVIFVPANAVQMTIHVATTALSPVPFPGLPIFVKKSDFPTPTSFDFVGTNQLVISGGSLNPLDTTWFYAVGNSSTQTVTFNLRTDVQFTNDNGNFIEVLSNLNNSIGTAPYYYRYESGTSMSAADVSGVLALMQEFFERPPLGLTIHSPALMKALLINGARSAGNLYDLSVTNAMNFQGWGLINLTNSLPGGLLTPNPPTNSMYFFDQSPAGALATGQSHTRILQVASGAAQNQPLRITLVWTDPPGNPAASIKLVNDLDLIVTNLDTGDVFFGNDIAGGNDFTLPWDTNSAPNIDSVNNVENVYLEPILDVNYSVTVVGRRVNVNAVTAHTNNVAQDYALVISCGNGRTTNALTLSPDTGIVTNNPPQVTVVTNNIPLVPGNGMIGGILLHQHVGANPPLLGTNLVPLPNDADAVLTEGVTNQWHFYVITNDLGFTNGNFHTFAPVNLALPRMGAREGEEGNNPTRAEADIDLYVSRDPALTNLDPAAITGAFKSLGRGGTEDVLFSNAVQGAYFIGIKSEDHQAAEYGFAAFFSELPVGNTDTNGQRLQIVYVPQGIPDGTPQHPGSIAIFGFSPE